jgi:mono/diheme cytochrome c family protein
MRYVVALVLLLVALVVFGTGGFIWYAWHGSIAPIAQPARASFDPAAVARGARLAALGDCMSCHTVPGGTPFAGGRGVQTPFGTVYASNITPDPATGIGTWSETAFRRAMQQGVDRGGHHLYPAFPYDHFDRVSDADDADLYDYLMTREPAKATIPSNDLPFPLNIRFLIAGWKLFFLHSAPLRPDPTQTAEWNRGAYLVEGLAHCGACHTPRNWLGAEKSGQRFAGAEVQGWYAYALDAASPAPQPWTADALYAYLRHGWQAQHGDALGPMGEVTHNLANAPDEDVRAIATYVAWLIGPGVKPPATPAPTPTQVTMPPPTQAPTPPAAKAPTPSAAPAPTPSAAQAPTPSAAPAPTPSAAQAPTPSAAQAPTPSAAQAPTPSAAQAPTPSTGPSSVAPGEALYRGACAACHESGHGPPFGGIDLALSSALHAPDPATLANIVMGGIPANGEDRAPIMPGFGAVLTDQQILDLLTWLRTRFGPPHPWSDIPAAVQAARDRTTELEAAQ